MFNLNINSIRASVQQRRASRSRRKCSRRRLIEPLELRALLAAAPTPQLVADLNTSPLSSNPTGFLKIGNITYFSADDGIHGKELWETDGTAGGTKLVRDINTGLGSDPISARPEPGASNPTGFTNVNGALVFTADDGIHGPQLWKSNGTVNGTVRLTSLKPGLYPPSAPTGLTAVGGTVFFVDEADVTTPQFSTAGYQLWSVNVATGKVQLDSTYVGAVPANFATINGALYFSANESLSLDSNNLVLWKSNGTATGTMIVKEIAPAQLTAAGGKLYFIAFDDTTGRDQLWTSNGTAAGTVPFSNLSPSTPFTFDLAISNLGGATPSLYSLDNDQLWKSDGTDAGSQLVKDLSSIANGFYQQSINVNGELFFTLDNFNTPEFELWKSDGTDAGTQLVGALPDYLPLFNSGQPEFTVSGGTLFFTFSSMFDTGEEQFRQTTKVWASDGTSAGTGKIEDLNGPLQSLIPGQAPGTLFFAKYDAAHGTELWKTNGTAAGTALLKDINANTDDARIEELVNANGKLYFAINDFNVGASCLPATEPLKERN